ncbi:MAG: hypothetical protein JJU12_07710 [Chlamydiales bacterium]|nr:hypothetical protein [Chlamydiales bacterium]
MINSIYSSFSDQSFHQLYGSELSAIPENLRWALQQKNVLNFTFKEGCHRYSLLEFAIKCDDYKAVYKAIQSGADLTYSEASGSGNPLHFYIQSLNEYTPPNLEILNLLTDYIDINDKESSYSKTPLECALEHMAGYLKIHWKVIEILLEKGSKIERNLFTGKRPVETFIDPWVENSTRKTYLKEFTFLKNLVQYIELEKKYYPDSSSPLTLEQFKKTTSTILEHFEFIAEEFRISSYYFNLTGLIPDETKSTFKYRKEACKYLVNYNYYFHKLLPGHAFKECFDLWILPSLCYVCEGIDRDYALSLKASLQ